MDPILSLPSRTPIIDPNTKTIAPQGQGGKVQPGTSAVLPTDGLVLQSVIGKWMGNLAEWSPHLKTTSQRGYNMLHFTPLQERGDSDSPYSIYDQLSFANDLFTHLTTDEKTPLSAAQKQKEIASTLAKTKAELGMLSLTDVVWNHTANNSDWLLDHPDAGYNAFNSPHLEPALRLDRALYQFSLDFPRLGLPTDIKTEADLALVLDALKNKLLPGLRLWEHYVIDVASAQAALPPVWSSSATSKPGASDAAVQSEQELVTLIERECLPPSWRHLGAKYHAQVDLERAVPFLKATCGDDLHAATAKLGQVLDELNVEQYKMYDDDVQSIIDNTRSRVQWQRMAANGPRLGPVNKKAPLVDRFFTELPECDRTAKHDPKAMALANNGWIWNADPLTDFASADSRAYTRREVIAWGE